MGGQPISGSPFTVSCLSETRVRVGVMNKSYPGYRLMTLRQFKNPQFYEPLMAVCRERQAGIPLLETVFFVAGGWLKIQGALVQREDSPALSS